MKDIKKYISVFFVSLILSAGVSVNNAAAFTEVMISNDDCTISIFLRKEFSVMTSPALTAWLNQLNTEIANATTQKDRDLFTSQRDKVQNIINNYPVITDAQVEALAQKWKREIEDKWNNNQNYLHSGHCKVRVVMVCMVRKESDPPRRGFDQIRIAPGDFRSYVEGNWNFDANGFSDYPYSNVVHGVWSMNTVDDYTAPHEAGHEMGLKDRYRDRAGGGADVEAGYENDLYGGPAGRPRAAQLSALQVVSTGAGGVRINNLETILKGRNILCPVGGVVQNPRAIIDYSNIPFPRRDKMPGRTEEKCTTCKDAAPVTTPPVTQAPPDTTKPAEETVQYREDKLEDVTTDTAIATKDTPDGTQIDVSVLPTGKGIDFREWEVKDITLVVDGGKIKPVKKDNFYTDKGSYSRGPAALVIIALGAQYEPYVKEAESGTVCPVTGKKTEASKEEHHQSDAERAAVAAGVGLIASQAKGTITGKKCSFNLDKNTADKIDGKDDYARVTVMNESKNIERTVKVPLR